MKVAILLALVLVSQINGLPHKKSPKLPQIIQDFIPMSNANRPGTIINPGYITIHNTANTNVGADAKAHANYVKNPSTQVSWHYTVDDHQIYQHLPTNEVGWHAGTSAGNSQSIGIEICENADGNHEVAVQIAQELVGVLMANHGIGIGRVVSHQHWSGKYCPNRLLDRWQWFLDGIQKCDTCCTGRVNASGGLNIRATPSSSGAITGSYVDGASVNILGRTTGSDVSGNPNWFQVANGYVSAYYVPISSGNGQPWCAQ